MNVLTNAATIIVIDSEEEYHTLKTWGLAIGNTNYIGEPEVETHYVSIPGVARVLDLSEALTGRTNFTKRKICIQLGGKKKRTSWDNFMSDIRNKIHGRNVKIIFDNDKGYYWKGRAIVTGFERNREIGTFNIEIPNADPYKYEICDSVQKWIWDTFNFYTGIIDDNANISVNGSMTYTIRAKNMPIVPTLIADSIGTEGLTVSPGDKILSVREGKNRFPELTAYNEEKTYTFSGKGNVTIQYRRGSL